MSGVQRQDDALTHRQPPFLLRPARLARRSLLFAPLGLLVAPRCVRAAQQRYQLDPRTTTIGFSVSHLGMFDSQGWFRRFAATLDTDEAHLDRTRIAVDVDASSIDMPWREAADMLRSPDFFDVARYPTVRFTSDSVTPLETGRYQVAGQMNMRGVARPIMLEAKLVDRHIEPALGGIEVADFLVTGQVRRSAFGMDADRFFISDRVAITIHARIQIGPNAG